MEISEILSHSAIWGAVGTYMVKTALDTFKKKNQDLTSNTKAVTDLTKSIEKLEKDMAEIPKLRLDLRRYYTAVKILAGDKWPDIRKELDEEFKSGG